MRLIAPDLDDAWDPVLHTFRIVEWSTGRLVAWSGTSLMAMELQLNCEAQRFRAARDRGRASGAKRRAA